ncbi:hypothetical protein [Novosphingobium guangzhouense]|uniref:hypothetical protein n=1 Tax=Novosphingobium guangzhouense TaxID=1850347 RepID=UPI001473C94D|nr:hypothetical protein [Novosphingobium guangzhouense]
MAAPFQQDRGDNVIGTEGLRATLDGKLLAATILPTERWHCTDRSGLLRFLAQGHHQIFWKNVGKQVVAEEGLEPPTRGL